MNIKIMVVTQKPYRMPQGECYLPIQTGNAPDVLPGIQRDSVGENISLKNPYYSELVALYWAWKNLRADYIGLMHYRRQFVKGHPLTQKAKWAAVLTDEDWQAILQDNPIVVPDKRRYYIETNYSHYSHAHYEKDLIAVGDSIEELCPEYLSAFQKVMGRTWAHMFNMCVMREDLFKSYAKWLFGLLERVEEKTNPSNYNDFQRRLYGFLAELLLDAWLETRQLNYKEVNVAFMEHQNWFKKGGKFLARKFLANEP